MKETWERDEYIAKSKPEEGILLSGNMENEEKTSNKTRGAESTVRNKNGSDQDAEMESEDMTHDPDIEAEENLDDIESSLDEGTNVESHIDEPDEVESDIDEHGEEIGSDSYEYAGKGTTHQKES